MLFAALAPFTFQGQAGSAQRSLPPPTDIDAQFTEQLGQAEQLSCKAILNKDAGTLDSLVSPNFALRVADVPQAACEYRLDGSTRTGSRAHIASNITSSRANSPTISGLSAWSGVRRGRPMDGTLAANSIWSICGKEQQELEDHRRYSTPLGNFPERPARQLPPLAP